MARVQGTDVLLAEWKRVSLKVSGNIPYLIVGDDTATNVAAPAADIVLPMLEKTEASTDNIINSFMPTMPQLRAKGGILKPSCRPVPILSMDFDDFNYGTTAPVTRPPGLDTTLLQSAPASAPSTNADSRDTGSTLGESVTPEPTVPCRTAPPEELTGESVTPEPATPSDETRPITAQSQDDNSDNDRCIACPGEAADDDDADNAEDNDPPHG